MNWKFLAKIMEMPDSTVTDFVGPKICVIGGRGVKKYKIMDIKWLEPLPGS